MGNLDPMLAPRVINTMQDELRRQLAVLIEAFSGNGSCDAIGDLARLYPTQVFLTSFGLPLEDRDQFIEWAEFVIEHAGGRHRSRRVKCKRWPRPSVRYLRQCVDAKRRAPGDDTSSPVSWPSAVMMRGMTRRSWASASC